jgi:hypothetical protein
MNLTPIEPNTMIVVPCLCGLQFALPITPDLISQGQGSKTTSIMTLDDFVFFVFPFILSSSTGVYTR